MNEEQLNNEETKETRPVKEGWPCTRESFLGNLKARDVSYVQEQNKP